MINSVILTTGGFLYMDVHDTRLMTDVQYLAPLMAQFNLHIGDSEVLTHDDGNQLTVQWWNVSLHNTPSAGTFTFQCTLHKNGSIWFAYKRIPIPVNTITEVAYHPVRVGISDAFVIKRISIPEHRIYRFFYIYSEINITKSRIVTGSAVVFDPQKTLEYHNLYDSAFNSPSEAGNTIDFLRHGRLRRDVNSSILVNDTGCGNCSDSITTLNHKYYKSQVIKKGQKYWRELRGRSGTFRHPKLSDTFLSKKTLNLKFSFPYYGHMINSVILTTGGFLYMDVHDTKLMTEVQYLAPLMAQFNLHIGDSEVLTNDDGEQLTVQWWNVSLHNTPSAGTFTFQCTLHKNGSIWFAYKRIPIPVNTITEVDYHPVRVGISDAFVIKRISIPEHRIYRFFYIYSEINITKSRIVTGSAVVFDPQKSCISGSGSCEKCMAITNTTEFNCSWCPHTEKCSDGADRYREEWERSGCSADAVKQLTDGKCLYRKPQPLSRKVSKGIGAGAIVAICIVLVLIIAVVAWCVYAYRHPTSKSGLFLIEATRSPRKLFSRSSDDGSQSNTAAPSDVKPEIL